MANILVVDDSTVDCLLFRTFVERVPGYRVIEAKDGVHALKQIEEWGIELIVTDLMMPNMDGLELLRTVRRLHPRIPVIIATGKGDKELAAQALELGAAGFLQKSRLDELLISTIQSALAKSNADTNSSD